MVSIYLIVKEHYKWFKKDVAAGKSAFVFSAAIK